MDNFFFFLDADDRMAGSNVLEKLYGAAVDKKVAVCGGNFEVEVDNRRSFHQDNEMRFSYAKFIHYRDWQYDYGYYRFIFQTDLVQSNHILFTTLLRYQAPLFFVKILTLVDKFYVLPLTTYVWRWHEVRWNTKKVEDLLEGILLVASFARDHRFEKLLWPQMLSLVVEYKAVVLQALYSDARMPVLSRIVKCGDVFAFLRRKVKSPFEKLLNCFEITPLDILVAQHRGML